MLWRVTDLLQTWPEGITIKKQNQGVFLSHILNCLFWQGWNPLLYSMHTSTQRRPLHRLYAEHFHGNKEWCNGGNLQLVAWRHGRLLWSRVGESPTLSQQAGIERVKNEQRLLAAGGYSIFFFFPQDCTAAHYVATGTYGKQNFNAKWAKMQCLLPIELIDFLLWSVWGTIINFISF